MNDKMKPGLDDVSMQPVTPPAGTTREQLAYSYFPENGPDTEALWEDDSLLQSRRRWKQVKALAEVFWSDSNPNDTDKFGAWLNEAMLAEESIARHRPFSFRGMICMLDVAVEILAEREIRPGTPFAEGPVLKMVLSVRDALDKSDLDGCVAEADNAEKSRIPFTSGSDDSSPGGSGRQD